MDFTLPKASKLFSRNSHYLLLPGFEPIRRLVKQVAKRLAIDTFSSALPMKNVLESLANYSRLIYSNSRQRH